MTTKKILQAARDRIAGHWTQGAVARNSAGKAVTSEDVSATCWCAIGAIRASGQYSDGANGAIALINTLVSESYLDRFNDSIGRTEAEILALFDRAIAAC